MELRQARELAEKWAERLRPHCVRIEIAGSVRRGKAEVHDIDLVVTPRFEQVGGDLFGPRLVNMLLVALNGGLLGGRKVKGGERYWQIAMPEGINLELYMIFPPKQWGILYTIRTGPGDFAKWIVTPRQKSGALPSNCRVSDGQLYRGEEDIPMPEEMDFLNFLGLGWIEPGKREAKWRRT